MHSTLIDAATAGKLSDALFLDCGFDLTDPQAGDRQFLAGHVPGAQHLDLDRDLAAPAGDGGRHPLPDREALAHALRGAGLQAGQQVVVYDSGDGAFAARAWWLLRWLGHAAVAVLDGGLAAWHAAGLPLETGAAKPAVLGNFRATAEPVLATVTADQVLAGLAAQSLVIVDARAAERFRGEVAMFDAVPGHIPGARNRPYKDNLAPDGRFKLPASLAAEFKAVLGDSAVDAVVLQCGSGVTACHNALAMEVAGLIGARLYPGSWSEWIIDPVRPVATGA